jgi:crotonobetaine/carnitine-CoA ligase
VRRPTWPSMPCSQLGEDDLKVTAALQANQWLSAAELFEWRVTQLPYFAFPRSIEFRDDLPRSPVGRVRKRELSEGGETPEHLGRRDGRH